MFGWSAKIQFIDVGSRVRELRFTNVMRRGADAQNYD